LTDLEDIFGHSVRGKDIEDSRELYVADTSSGVGGIKLDSMREIVIVY